jgi:hypothetical protein
LITHVARALLVHIRKSLEPSSYRAPLTEEARATLQRVETEATRWLERTSAPPQLADIDPATKQEFRAWWASSATNLAKLKGVSFYSSDLANDVGNAISHNVRYVAANDEQMLAHIPNKYTENLRQQNHWKKPTAEDGQYHFFKTAVHQISGYGSSWQSAPIEHVDDVLLLQIQGDAAFLDWLTNSGWVLHFWINKEALSKLDFSAVEATLESD